MASLATDGRDAFIRFWSSLHEATYQVTNGRALGRVLGMPVVRLTTKGRTSGQPRSTVLTAPVADADRIVLVASNGGDARNPQWFLNLLADPTVLVTLEGRDLTMEGREVRGAEREALWNSIRAATPIYELYQRRTTRELPVVLLESPSVPSE